ncbi:hypothetical protein L198_07290 [Cryptococcus wingfieldii CBS 7118]|uniref:NAD-dependent epimerase/dehydratase domain-containing protein n=1 Tax=Cryptococcus wingfieldii CBS 7118 TaxID=1295528 RepID=A0A1E3IDU0_9TREE|nr:hypothetical protein L198_07290 [Cryptococcus wingfieldii CBS 7118]ODN86595.1 hypothetical protein L198_07290 [Cryptococcus wingfieldii CBS 7118]
MPSPVPIIAITGINGFVATELVLLFLAREWHVRGSVRTPDKAAAVKTHPAYERFFQQGSLEVVVVEDLDESDLGPLMEGVQAVAHLAAPLPKLDDPSLTLDDFKRPIVEPVLRILQQAHKPSSTIKSIAFMSSAASSVDLGAPPGKVYTENNWTPYTDEDCKSLDPHQNPMASVIWYFTAKKQAEQAAFEFHKIHQPAFSITTFCPPMIYGPAHYLQPGTNMSTVTGSQEGFVSLFKGRDAPLPGQFFWSFVDVRDVVDAFHVALTKTVSGRFLVSGHEYTWQEFTDKLQLIRPDLSSFFPLGQPKCKSEGGGYTPAKWAFDSKKLREELGIECM